MWCRCCSVPARSTWQPAHGWRGGSWLITTFTSPKTSAGTMTAQSMWVSCNQYMGVLDSPYSADAIHIATRKRARQEGDLQMQWKTNIPDIHSYAHNEASALVFSRGTQVQQEWKKFTNCQHRACISYLRVKERRGVRPGSWSSTSWGERSADRVFPEPSRSRVT